MRTRLLADATLIRYGACTYSGMLAAFSTSASSRGLGFFQLCGLPRKNCTTSAPSASAAARGSSWWTCEPISTPSSLVMPGDTATRPTTAVLLDRQRSMHVGMVFAVKLVGASCGRRCQRRYAAAAGYPDVEQIVLVGRNGVVRVVLVDNRDPFAGLHRRGHGVGHARDDDLRAR